MTLDPEVDVKKPSTPERKQEIDIEDIRPLEDLFNLGYTKSGPVTVLEDENGNKIIAEYRTLTPSEQRDIFEVTSEYSSPASQAISLKLETLARAVQKLNGMPLILDSNDVKKYEDAHNGKSPSALEQARFIMYNNMKSHVVIDILYEGYENFMDDVNKTFENIKKKSNSQNSSS